MIQIARKPEFKNNIIDIPIPIQKSMNPRSFFIFLPLLEVLTLCIFKNANYLFPFLKKKGIIHDICIKFRLFDE